MNRVVVALIFCLLVWASRTPISLTPTLVQDGDSFSVLAPGSATSYTLYATPTRVLRPRSVDARPAGQQQSLTAPEWDEVDTIAPDVTDMGTLRELAAIAGSAYVAPGRKERYDLPEHWNATLPIGGDGATMMRGHVFVDTRDNATVVISIKGTTPFGGPTRGEDRRNDNLMFSCCCARSKAVCGCFSKGSRCDVGCVEDALTEDSLFYNFGINLYNNVTYLFPHATIWLVGHSLGGALAALIGATFGAPTVAFSAPGERLAAARLHLPLRRAPVTHVVHTADPVPYGACALCARAGFALETRCHLGVTLAFDSVARFGWAQDVRRHPMRVVVDQVLGAGGLWPDVDGVHRDVPLARVEEDCEDCYKWTFDDAA